ncbi:PEGA domain-containing protein [Patescibacteria group bacterium]
MKKAFIFVGLGLVLLGVGGFFLFTKVFNKPGKAALQIASTPNSKVFLDGEEVGTTPYFNDDLEAGEAVVKLEASEQDSGLVAWEGRVTLVSNIVTSINYQLGGSEGELSGEILSLERIGDSKVASLAVITQPEEALVRINDESKGFSPVSVEDLDPGEYQITVSAPGFKEKTISGQTIAGYKLEVSVRLAREEIDGVTEATESSQVEEDEDVEEDTEEDQDEVSKESDEEDEPEPTKVPVAEALEKPYVKILSTPTGWLRVRLGPTTTATEAAKVDPGETFPYLDESENGWYKIEYETDEEGWVSGVYAELVE